MSPRMGVLGEHENEVFQDGHPGRVRSAHMMCILGECGYEASWDRHSGKAWWVPRIVISGWQQIGVYHDGHRVGIALGGMVADPRMICKHKASDTNVTHVMTSHT